MLGLFVLDGDDDAGFEVGDTDGRVGGVDALAAVAGGAVDVDTDLVVGDIDVDGLGLGKHDNRGGGGVQAAGGFGAGDALDTVDAGLVLQPAEGALAADFEDGLFESAPVGDGAAQGLDLPATPVGEAGVHAD